jgi:N-glycosylase/DNA lyase
MRVLVPERFNLDVTLFGGQAFRWRRDEQGRISGWIGDRPVRVATTPEGLEVSALDGREEGLEEAVRRYFDLSRDYAAIERRLFRDAALRRAASRVAGFRILRQPPFETLVGFITSANNNIVRLSRSMDAISRIAGQAVETEIGTMWAFPEPAALAAVAVDRLREEAGLGYRDRYVADAARLVASGEVDLDALDRLSTPALREALRAIPGVGPKVADCIALYGFGRVEVFPVDTWVRKAFTALYLSGGERVPDREIARLAAERFGPYAGVAQQHMFEAFRRGTQTSPRQSEP